MKPLPYNNATQAKKSTQQAKALKLMAICLMLFSGCTCSKQSPLKAYRYTPPPPPPPPQETWTWTKLNCPTLGPVVVAVGPTNGNILYVGSGRDSGGVWKSVDGGNSFSKVWAEGAFDLAIDPRNPQVVYAACHMIGVWRSRDGGASWAQLTPYYADFVKPDWFDSTYIYAGAWRSTDYGTTWSLSLPFVSSPDEISGLDQSKQNPNLLYGGRHLTTGGWIFKSLDRGTSWSEVRGALGGVFRLAVSPISDQWVYADADFGGAGGDSILKTTDGGSNWKKYGIGTDRVNLYIGLAVEPRPGVGNVLYTGGYIATPDSGKGVYRSENGGEAWEQIGLKGIAITNLAVDRTSPTSTTVIYATAGDQGAPSDGLYRGVLTKK